MSCNNYAFLSTENGQTDSKGKVSPNFTTKVMLKIDNDRIFIAGMQGKWKVVGSNGRDLEKGKLSDPRTPRFVKKVPIFLSIYRDKKMGTSLNGDTKVDTF
ncbi:MULTISPECIES: hypothetical protein [Bacillus]|uniref:hypothetical protein n=1 Tax=Bacillus TaxID=1386 RepID=UPI0020C7DAF1|nr:MULTISPECIES: hypothetical protein [Bacillus]